MKYFGIIVASAVSYTHLTYNDYYLANPYLQMLKDGKVPMSTIDDKASRILRLIFRTAMNRQKPYGSVATEEHYACLLYTS